MTVFRKELADHFTSWRFIVLFTIVFAVGIIAIYLDAQYIRAEVIDTRFVFLKLYTSSGELVPLLTFFLVFFMPIIGIVLGFDAINSERNNGTLSRLLAQPIFRDSVINAKFLAGIITIAIMLVSMVMLVGGLGLRMIGVPPSPEEVIRLMAFIGAGVVYAAFWLGLAMLFSIFLKRVATSALVSIALWMFFIFLFVFPSFVQLGKLGFLVMMLSPITIFSEIISTLLIPSARTMGQILQTTSGLVPANPLSLGQSLLHIWPHLVSLLALTAVCFAISYIKFMREEIRST
ncbi:ABC transporter permease [Candidatus Omnitrophota bacterium]